MERVRAAAATVAVPAVAFVGAIPAIPATNVSAVPAAAAAAAAAAAHAQPEELPWDHGDNVPVAPVIAFPGNHPNVAGNHAGNHMGVASNHGGNHRRSRSMGMGAMGMGGIAPDFLAQMGPPGQFPPGPAGAGRGAHPPAPGGRGEAGAQGRVGGDLDGRGRGGDAGGGVSGPGEGPRGKGGAAGETRGVGGGSQEADGRGGNLDSIDPRFKPKFIKSGGRVWEMFSGPSVNILRREDDADLPPEDLAAMVAAPVAKPSRHRRTKSAFPADSAQFLQETDFRGGDGGNRSGEGADGEGGGGTGFGGGDGGTGAWGAGGGGGGGNAGGRGAGGAVGVRGSGPAGAQRMLSSAGGVRRASLDGGGRGAPLEGVERRASLDGGRIPAPIPSSFSDPSKPIPTHPLRHRSMDLSNTEIGRGRSGSIRQCVHRRSNEVYACKTIPKGKIQSEEEAEDVRREVEVLEAVRGHPCSVQLQGVFEDAEHVHLVIDLCQGGDLWQRVQQGGPYGEREAAAVVGRLVGLLRDLHAQGIMHRDVKPENVLLRGDDDDVDIAVIDYGVSVFFNPGERFSEIVGSPFYIAPEVLHESYGPESDIWAAGVILFVLLSGALPFWGDSDEGVFRAILEKSVEEEVEREGVWESVSDEAKDLVLRMLTKDPALRITADEILGHQWLQEISDATHYSKQQVPRRSSVRRVEGGGAYELENVCIHARFKGGVTLHRVEDVPGDGDGLPLCNEAGCFTFPVTYTNDKLPRGKRGHSGWIEDATAVIMPLTAGNPWHFLHHVIPLSHLLASQHHALRNTAHLFPCLARGVEGMLAHASRIHGEGMRDAVTHMQDADVHGIHARDNAHIAAAGISVPPPDYYSTRHFPWWPLLAATAPPGITLYQVNQIENVPRDLMRIKSRRRLSSQQQPSQKPPHHHHHRRLSSLVTVSEVAALAANRSSPFLCYRHAFLGLPPAFSPGPLLQRRPPLLPVESYQEFRRRALELAGVTEDSLPRPSRRGDSGVQTASSCPLQGALSTTGETRAGAAFKNSKKRRVKRANNVPFFVNPPSLFHPLNPFTSPLTPPLFHAHHPSLPQ
ncbi:unnamed protein product [Closterium sp. Yama58-4]|nr:unnamed protein product [Closterium sp. Yama58-4]